MFKCICLPGNILILKFGEFFQLIIIVVEKSFKFFGSQYLAHSTQEFRHLDADYALLICLFHHVKVR